MGCDNVDANDWASVAAWAQVCLAAVGLPLIIFELRQTSKALRLSLYNETKLSWNALNADAHGIDSIKTLLKCDHETIFVHNVLLHMERSHYLAHEGLLDGPTQDAEMSQLLLFMQLPRFREVWKESRSSFRAPFRSYVDGAMKNVIEQ
jgi:hypothetical protein